MISVKTLFDNVQTLAAKDRGGYSSAFEFNSMLELAQITLLEFHADNLPSSQATDALVPFLRPDVEISIGIEGIATYPEDYYRILDVRVSMMVNSSTCGEGPQKFTYPTEQIALQDANKYRQSKIRGGKARKSYLYYQSLSGIHFLPLLQGKAVVSYITLPTTAIYGVTDTAGGEEYDGSASTDLDWPQEQLSNLTDLMLSYKGIQIREGVLSKFVLSKTQTQLKP